MVLLHIVLCCIISYSVICILSYTASGYCIRSHLRAMDPAGHHRARHRDRDIRIGRNQRSRGIEEGTDRPRDDRHGDGLSEILRPSVSSDWALRFLTA